MRRGFLLGKFMPPHAGQLLLCESAMRLVDELTVLVCHLPDDPVPGELRVKWMRELLPGATVISHEDVVPQLPEDHPDFWAIWRDIVRRAHPDPIDRLFAGEAYGKRLAVEVGAQFVPLGARVMGADASGLGGVSGAAIRADPSAHWRWLPPPVRAHYTRVVCLHGVESTGKSVLAARLAAHFGTVWVPEYGRAHAENFGGEMDEADLLLIGEAQSATIAAARRQAGPVLIADTDALMTAAWAQMMLGHAPGALMQFPRADLYLHLAPDVPWVDDGTRIYGDERRTRFDRLARAVLDDAGVASVVISGGWAARFDAAISAIEDLLRADRNGRVER